MKNLVSCSVVVGCVFAFSAFAQNTRGVRLDVILNTQSDERESAEQRETVYLPISDMLVSAGCLVVTNNQTNASSTLTVNIAATGIGAMYHPVDISKPFEPRGPAKFVPDAGVNILGTMVLETEGKPYKRTFSGRKLPPEGLLTGGRFSEALEGKHLDALSSLLVEAWKVDLLQLALRMREIHTARNPHYACVDDWFFEALGTCGKAATPYLVDVLERGHYSDAERAARALTKIRDPSALPALRATLTNAYWASTKLEVARALGALQDRQSLPTLRQVLKDEMVKNPYSPELRKDLPLIIDQLENAASARADGTDSATTPKSPNESARSATERLQSGDQHRPASPLPPFKEELQGTNPVRVRNPNAFAVSTGLRSDGKGRNFDVPANDVNTVYLPNGKYDIYFVYSDKPGTLFQGDSFTLNNNGVEIQIVKVVNGNYGIRQVK